MPLFRHIIALALSLALLTSCYGGPRATPLPPEQFEVFKHLPPTQYSYTRYIGAVNGYETLELYESPSNSGLTPIKTSEYYLDPDFYLKETLTLHYSKPNVTHLTIPAKPSGPFSISVPDIHETRVTIESVDQKSPHPSIIGEIDKVTFKLQAGQAVPQYPNCQTIILFYDQHNLVTSKKFVRGDTWSIAFTPAGDFHDLTPKP